MKYVKLKDSINSKNTSEKVGDSATLASFVNNHWSAEINADKGDYKEYARSTFLMVSDYLDFV